MTNAVLRLLGWTLGLLFVTLLERMVDALEAGSPGGDDAGLPAGEASTAAAAA